MATDTMSEPGAAVTAPALDDSIGGADDMGKRTCSIDGCGKPHAARGWCYSHWERWKRHGDPLAGKRINKGKRCSVDECDRPAHSLEMCTLHYGRFLIHGDPLGGGPRRIVGDDAARFWSKVDKTDACWLWTGALNNSGYGTIKINGVTVGAHRHSFLLAGRAIPEGLDLDHLCSVRRCVNPDHLEPVTRAENLRRAVERGEVT